MRRCVTMESRGCRPNLLSPSSTIFLYSKCRTSPCHTSPSSYHDASVKAQPEGEQARAMQESEALRIVMSPEAHKKFWDMCDEVFDIEKVPRDHLHPEYAYEETDVLLLRKKKKKQ
ncbi:protein-lysine N-methyltransferase [Arachis hypogaea]|nr:protein-lysine N-methyltransferase [Arachis hypogaea]